MFIYLIKLRNFFKEGFWPSNLPFTQYTYYNTIVYYLITACPSYSKVHFIFQLPLLLLCRVNTVTSFDFIKFQNVKFCLGFFEMYCEVSLDFGLHFGGNCCSYLLKWVLTISTSSWIHFWKKNSSKRFLIWEYNS